MLLRFLQSGEGLAVGATRSTRVDVRVIAATHRDLEAAVELGRVVYRAVAVPRRGAVQPEDVKLPALRRKAPVVPAPAPTADVAGPVIPATLTRYQAEALRLASAGGEVRRGDLMARCGITSERARRTLTSLVERDLLRWLGSGRGAWYVLRGPGEAGG